MSSNFLSAAQERLLRLSILRRFSASYRQVDLISDLTAGLIVAIMLIPQAMAYALLAGLPPQIGLYAGILPPLIYGLLGTSRVLAVGPVALVSLLVAGEIARNPGDALSVAISLALMVAALQIIMGLLRLGNLMNFISHPVLSGFTSAAAFLIGISQAGNFLGYIVPAQENFFQTFWYSLVHIGELNPRTTLLGAASLGLLLYFRYALAGHLKKLGFADPIILPITRSGALIVVVAGTLLIWLTGSQQTASVAVVGAIPHGLPALTLPGINVSLYTKLLPTSLTISLVGYLESISVARALASKQRLKVDANQELIALGTANLGAAFTGAYPVTGGLSRSVVNYSVGARSGLASIFTAGFVTLTVLFFTPAFTYLPKTILAAIILSAVANLIDWETLSMVWRYNKADAISLLSTFSGVLLFGIETGILIGVGATLVLYIWRTSKPHFAIVGQVGQTEHYRNVLRHPVTTLPHVLAIRVDESLYFANAQFLENAILAEVAEHAQVKHLVLICSAINFIDASALETLDRLNSELSDSQVTLHLAEVKGPVMDRLERVGLLSKIGREHIFLSTHQAVQTLAAQPA